MAWAKPNHIRQEVRQREQTLRKSNTDLLTNVVSSGRPYGRGAKPPNPTPRPSQGPKAIPSWWAARPARTFPKREIKPTQKQHEPADQPPQPKPNHHNH